MRSNKLASVDLGTNTARLLIGSCHDGKIERDLVARRITRLGGGFCKERGISAEALDRTRSAMNEFAALLQRHRVSSLRAVATSAVRDAVNRDSFCREIERSSGISLEVISGEEEGTLTLRGVVSALDVIPEALIVVDVGGGSTEYTVSRGNEVIYTNSLPLGVVRLTEGKGSITAMSDKIDRELGILARDLKEHNLDLSLREATLVATAGTATTLAAIDLQLADYDYRKVNNHCLTAAGIREIFDRLLPLTPAERLQRIPGMEKGREDLIIAGILLTVKSMDLFGISTLKVSDYGLLEGVMLDLAETVCKPTR